MAREAIRGIQRIVIVDVAVGAGRGLVRTDQREASDAVIERRAIPTFGSVTVCAIGGGKRRARRGVNGRSGLLPLGEVASGISAIGGSRFQRVVIVDMAERALNIGVAIGERKAGGGVIEFSVGPRSDGVASGASGGGRRKACGEVIGNIAADGLRFVPIRSVAGHAIGGIQRVVIVDVAGRTRRGSGGFMCTNQSETGNGVIEGSGVPPLGGVAVGTIGRSETGAGSGVNGIGGLLPSGEMATGVAAIGGSNLQIVIVVEMAGSAGHVGVTIGEEETRAAVVKSRGVPADRVVTVGAIGGGEGGTSRRMWRVGGLLPVG